MNKWVGELEKGEVRYDNPFDVQKFKRFAGSSRDNDPAREWDPKSLSSYFIVNSKYHTGESVALGNFMESTDKPFQLIAKKSDVPHASDQNMEYNPSQKITNSYKPWQSLVSRSFKDDKFEEIVRKEWSRDRAVEYLEAASQIEALQKHIMKKDACLYLVTGIILGVTAAESTKVVGYKVLCIFSKQAEEGGPSSGQTGNLKLGIREQKARSSSEAEKHLLGVAEEPSQQYIGQQTRKNTVKQPQHSAERPLWARTGRFLRRVVTTPFKLAIDSH
ncbi:MAG: hypothetical protein M1821_008488 [Bathelium mastoideum]|nr:MAG: hypothetical protein M1821_008488 [Bathelium mastoideum]